MGVNLQAWDPPSRSKHEACTCCSVLQHVPDIAAGPSPHKSQQLMPPPLIPHKVTLMHNPLAAPPLTSCP
jgi:hypothetical protein